MIEETEISILDRADIEEKHYQWEKAAELYEQAAGMFIEKNELENAAKIYNKLGDIYIRAIWASDTKESYLNWDEQAVKAFHNAESLFNQTNDKLLSMECKAKALNSMSMVITSIEQARKNLKKSIEIFLKLIEEYSKANDTKNCVRLSALTVDPMNSYLLICSNPSELDLYSHLARNLIEKVWLLLEEDDIIEIRERLLYSEIILMSLNRWTELIYGDEKQEEIYKRFLKRCQETLNLAENCNDYYILGSIYGITGFVYCIFGSLFVEEQKNRAKFAEKGFELMEKSVVMLGKSRNNLGVISYTYCLDYCAGIFSRFEYLQKRILNDVREVQKLDKIFDNLYTGVYCFMDFIPISYYNEFASRSFLKADTRKSYAKLGIKYADKTLKRLACGPYIVLVYQYLTHFYSQLAILTTEYDPQEEFIQKMLYYAKKAENLSKDYKGGNVKSAGFTSIYRAYRTIADINKDKEEKIKNLQIAIDAAKNNIKYSIESYRIFLAIQIRLALLYEELGILANEEKSLKEAREIFLHVIKETSEKGYYYYTASCYEYIARLEDRLGNHMISAEYYEKAQNAHEDSLSSIKYKPLKNRVNEKIEYVIAWSIIEKAKANHKKEKHLEAKNLYEKACDILKNLPTFNYEASYFSSWAILEEAEQLSKEERFEEAINSYERANEMFKNAKMVIRSYRKNVKRSKEIERLEKVASVRMNYCSARVNLENARILTKKGDHIEAAEKFAIAADQFKNICRVFKIERERGELKAVYHLCKAWENMELAEKTENPIKYSNSAKLFLKASELFIESKLKYLALGNSHFCLALELGCNFDRSNELEEKANLYLKVKSNLRNTSDSYEKGGFRNAADWALATSTYFDAAWHFIQADNELRIDKRKVLLDIGVSYLESAAEIFIKAGYKNKEKEVSERIKRIKKEEKILISALNTIKKPSISGSIEGIVAPSCPIETSQSPRIGEIQQYAEEVSTFLEKDSRKANLTDKIKIFVSYATADSNYFQVSNIANLLAENPDIEKVFYWEKDLQDDIYEYMNKNLTKCNIFLIFCSANANQSEPVQMEWQAALKIKKKIIPIFNNESDIPPLLSTKLGVQFIKNDIKKTTDQIFQLILKKLNL